MAPKAEKKPAKKVAKTAKTAGKKKSKAKVESFKIYIYKVLKQVSVSLSPVSILL
jgi:histone H2B